ncbi:MAG: dephospho-CoA kinase, partial [Vibrio sp.]
MPLIIGLTGGIASGKTKVSDYFASQYGIDIVDADVVAREVVAIGMPALNQIQSRFGDAILDPQGQLNRARLREIIFQNPEEKHWLESLLHPLIRQS